MTYKVYAPNIHLFAFHLRSAKTDSPEAETFVDESEELERDKNVTITDNLLWQKCSQIFEKINIKHLNLVDQISKSSFAASHQIGVLSESEFEENKLSLPFESFIPYTPQEELKITGFVYPLQTHDSYALWLNLRRPERENGKKTDYVELSFLGKCNPGDCLLPTFIKSSLGQTLLITLWIAEGQNYQDQQFLRQFADQSINNFITDPKLRPKFHRDGLLFGSPIFEYGIINQPMPYQHILVWLLSHPVTETKFQKCYKELMDLFYYRNKIIQSYQHSRQIYQQLSKDYDQVVEEVQSIENLSDSNSLKTSDLSKFKNLLKRLPKMVLEYSRLMRDLDQCRKTIRLNTENYEEKINRIQAKVQSDNLIFLENFSRKNCLHLQEEIEANLKYFDHEAALLEKMISAIRGMVDIEQTEHQRHRQDTLKVLGIGLGSALVVASSCPEIKPISVNQPLSIKPIIPCLGTIFISAAVGVLAAFIARWIWQSGEN